MKKKKEVLSPYYTGILIGLIQNEKARRKNDWLEGKLVKLISPEAEKHNKNILNILDTIESKMWRREVIIGERFKEEE